MTTPYARILTAIKKVMALANKKLAAKDSIARIYYFPYHPQSKHIERFFRTGHERVEIPKNSPSSALKGISTLSYKTMNVKRAGNAK